IAITLSRERRMASIAAADRPDVTDDAIARRVAKLALDAARIRIAEAGRQQMFGQVRAVRVAAIIAEPYHEPVILAVLHRRCPPQRGSKRGAGRAVWSSN